MNITKAVITAAGAAQRTLPLQSLVDRDGVSKSALQILLEEAISAGAGDICVVVYPGDEPAYKAAAGPHAQRLKFVAQDLPRGYGDAVARARSFTGNEAFLHLVGDHLSLSRIERSCARQLVDIAGEEACAVSAVQATRESLLTNFGAIGGKRVSGRTSLYAIENVLEKPTPTEAEQTLIVPGLRAGHYLCFFGMHVLTPGVMDLLERRLRDTSGNVSLSDALAALASHERYLAYEVQGARYDLGDTYGLLNAQLALALNGKDRADVLAQLLEVVASR